MVYIECFCLGYRSLVLLIPLILLMLLLMFIMVIIISMDKVRGQLWQHKKELLI